MTVCVTKQPVPKVYVITEDPAKTPVTTPLSAFIVATAGVPLLQVPPVVAELSVTVEPAHTLKVPVISAGKAFTTIVTLPVAVFVVLLPSVTSTRVYTKVPADDVGAGKVTMLAPPVVETASGSPPLIVYVKVYSGIPSAPVKVTNGSAAP